MPGFNDLLEEDKKKQNPLIYQTQPKAKEAVEAEEQQVENSTTPLPKEYSPLIERTMPKV